MGVTRVGISGLDATPGWRGDFYPKGLPAAPRAGVRRRAAHLDRDQRLLLLAAAALELCEVARGGARRLRVLGQGRPVHHPPEEAPRRRGRAGQLLRLRGARPGQRPGPVPVAAARDLALRRARCSRDFFDLLPRTTTEAARLATGHDDKVSGDKLWSGEVAERPLFHALEPRHTSFATDEAARAAAGEGRRPGGGRLGREVAAVRPRRRADRLRPPARRHRALRQRLQRRGARPAGPSGCAAGPRTGATPSSTSTTTPRDSPRTTPGG